MILYTEDQAHRQNQKSRHLQDVTDVILLPLRSITRLELGENGWPRFKRSTGVILRLDAFQFRTSSLTIRADQWLT